MPDAVSAEDAGEVSMKDLRPRQTRISPQIVTSSLNPTPRQNRYMLKDMFS